ncbi:polyketide cyclase / dehydrase and lipid transport [Williamsia sp. CHRR-6]|uniref:polyketide cyclase / dehydrase and lipid transport n=1 Tax=Williamsia sp. CHRR-6 TaxID=2835871 RepID=UPI001BDA9F33|nr:polyketide cyclase / dehydrase and lipid transport [Williamsia sp. CHRR-6]MBT0565292.1 polyketide cyclase / dehydrase and lipid transport [Williamsia sp. CHRR-6]
MSSIQVADETFVAASALAAPQVIADRGHWRRWWPDLRLTVVEDRGSEGIRWTVTGGLTGTMELWLQEMLDGFVLHYFLHAEPNRDGVDLTAENHRRRVAGRVMSTEVKDRLELGREVGMPAVAGS